MNWKRALSSLLLMGMIVGCGGSVQAYDSALDLADTIGCDDPKETEKLLGETAVACSIGGEDVEIATFGTEEGPRTYADIAGQFGSASLLGNRWVVVSKRSVLDDLQDQIGGEIAD